MVPKMTEKQKKEYFEYLASHRAEIESDQAFVDATIDEHLKFVPHKKLYKFRTCNNDNFETLAENCIWMPTAATFPDTFDSTINIDFEKNKKKLYASIKEDFVRLFYATLNNLFLQNGLKFTIPCEEFERVFNECVNKYGEIDSEKEKVFLISVANEEELSNFEKLFSNISEKRRELESRIPEIAENIVSTIEDICTRQRREALTYCMTSDHTNTALWENYANNYTGFCIEYSFENYKAAPFDVYKNLLYLMPITYKKRAPRFDIVKFLSCAAEEQIHHDTSWRDSPELIADINMQFYYKNSDYDYEKEWRFSIKNRNNSKQPFLFVSAIYAGKDIKPRNLQRLKKIAKKLVVPLYRQEQRRLKNGYNYVLVEEAKK